MIIKSNKNYFEHFYGMIAILVVVSVLVMLIKGLSLKIVIPLIILLAIYYLNRKFTLQVTINPNSIIIEYYRWFKKRTAVFNNDSISVRKSLRGSKSGRKHHVLEIIESDNVVYVIEESDGFLENDLAEAVRFLKSEKNSNDRN